MALTGRSDNATTDGANCTMTNVTVESGGFKEIMADLQQTWKLIAVMLSFSILISLIWILLLRFVGGKLVWVRILILSLRPYPGILETRLSVALI